jgi:hypothetical protein
MIGKDRFVAAKDTDYEGWLNARRYGVTATQVATASTPAGFEKAAVDFLTEHREPDNPYMEFGRVWESHIADFVNAVYEVRPNEWLIRGDNTTHLATPDGLSDDGKVIGEYKTTGKDWGTVEKLPVRYRRQVQWQLHVTGAESCVVAWLVREEVDGVFVPATFEPKCGVVGRDEEMIEGLVATADRLWSFVNGGME